MAVMKHVTVRMTITNRKAVCALGCAIAIAQERVDGEPWNEEAKKQLKALKYAAKSMRAEILHRKD